MQHHDAHIKMAAVKQQVLNWLYSVLTSEYHDITRSYGDVAQTLSHYSSLSPRTEVYTYENGKSALLLHLSGTLPVVFRGTTYRFPIALWIPHAYPLEPPLIYVVPTDGMMVRPGQHVDQQGKVYHPYLVGWAQYWDKSNILDFLAILREVFAKEPPVVSRQQQNPPPRPQSQAPPPIPPPPPGSVRSASISSLNGPPPPPPKPGSNAQQSPVGEPSRQDSGPPLPPLPSQLGNAQYGQQSPTYNEFGRNPQRTSSLRYETAPPLPLQPQRQQSLRQSLGGPVSLIPSPQAQSNQQQYQPLKSPNNSQPSHNPQQQFIRNNTVHQQPQWQQYSQQHPPQPQAKPPPPPDLMDGPLVLAVPSEASANLPAPPVPPNPEKDMLLHNIGRTLYAQRQHTRGLTASSLPGLESQRKAMLTSLNSMQAEIQALESLNNLLSSNTKILHTALHDADAVIDQSQHRTAPNIDELLVAPTVVGNQLYELVSEERSLGDALFVLGRAVEKGRITPAVFAKMTRTLAREWFLKKALVKKIGNGMGLATY